MQDFSPPYGVIENISPLIRRITANNPAPYTFKGTGTYIIGHKNVAVIDPGPDMADHIEAIISSLKGEKISHILVTHNHTDHSPGARPLAERCGAKIYGFDVSGQQYSMSKSAEGLDKKFKPDILIKDGDILKGKNWTLEAIHTPGHLSNHLCFALLEEKALFSGDHVMGWSTTIISPPDGNMTEYLISLEKLLMRDDNIYYPTHGWPIDDPKKFVKQVYAHRLRRDNEICRFLEQGDKSMDQIVRMIYPAIDKSLYLAASRTIFAHLIRLVELGKVSSDSPPTENSIYSLKK
ncbi:MAG: MBL fold metallo-hydrolase [Alphaproteobacteria bacterium]|nr:MBL fold metallo-hydrolase [Alphaproteobacteria bacterium]HPF47597.1 MBL fold metallo-hydrolase [Emcibacteraceae bacterium]